MFSFHARSLLAIACGLAATGGIVRLRQIAAAGSQSQQIARAIEWIKGNFWKPLRVEKLADHARMSTSTFHHHFRALPAFSPVQYQKQLRLQEARRLMLTDCLDASTAGFRVGYESASQFSRDYSRQFGATPLRYAISTACARRWLGKPHRSTQPRALGRSFKFVLMRKSRLQGDIWAFF